MLAVIQAFVIRALHIRAPSPGALLEAGVGMGMGEDEYITVYDIFIYKYIEYIFFILYYIYILLYIYICDT